ncbi:hypothetical protein PA7_41090 [Pseudonocardia asaccharolytica DSM 44247 = NBRC 16224]|uniref:Uncharacterized protein n=1 Tax=Pseudonocardia asaccharolytica DSM 44247 = NBRC 16224 TaxID=1123024 RepID=A0A511D653_9PSEU|nr:LarC family nickel insertion protein [Pseudonocardia asaccharolytica]GEL20272.1 hypothetical protein PA7_41090 [Pseudonocardia asaccharolytica DSM 44247 = NBRC 16224]
MGAGGRDVLGRANVVRVALGIPLADAPTTGSMWVLETNVDDLDPRVWPTVLATLLEAGAADAWLVPIVMKKGRPAYTLCVLIRDAERAALARARKVPVRQVLDEAVAAAEAAMLRPGAPWLGESLDQGGAAI